LFANLPAAFGQTRKLGYRLLGKVATASSLLAEMHSS
jgi:hypothetical protein